MEYQNRIIFLILFLTLTACGGSGNKKNSSAVSSSTITSMAGVTSSSLNSATISTIDVISSSLNSAITSNASITSSSRSSSSSSQTPIQTMTKIAGDMQISAPASALLVAPTIEVLGYNSKPVSGAIVTFTVSTGGGTIQNATVITDDLGHASAGIWTLGTVKGENTLTASVSGLSPIVFSARALTSSKDINILLPTGLDGYLVGENLRLNASVSSTYQLATVSVLIDGISYPMSASTSTSWFADLSFPGRHRGQIDMIINAADVYGNSTDVEVSVVLDRNPVISVTATPVLVSSSITQSIKFSERCRNKDSIDPCNHPQDSESSMLMSNKIDISAMCIADNLTADCTSLKIELDRFLDVAQSINSLTYTLDLSAYEEKFVTVALMGQNANGNYSYIHHGFYVETNPHILLRAEVDGSIWDVADTRILFLDKTAIIPALKVLDTATGTIQTIENNVGLVEPSDGYGFLTSTGAIYVRQSTNLQSSPNYVYEWRDGIVTQLSQINSRSSLRTAGNWAIYNNDYNLWQRNLITGVSTLVANAGNTDNDIASNGDVVYWSSYNIFKLQNNSIQQITSDDGTTSLNIYPITDGTNVAYLKTTQCCSNITYRLAMHDGNHETIITGVSNSAPEYKVAGGYIAYSVEDSNHIKQIWRHTPDGEQQVTFFGNKNTVYLNAIGADGTIVLTYGPKRYLARPGAELLEIGANYGRVVFINGKLFEFNHRSLLEIVP